MSNYTTESLVCGTGHFKPAVERYTNGENLTLIKQMLLEATNLVTITEEGIDDSYASFQSEARTRTILCVLANTLRNTMAVLVHPADKINEGSLKVEHRQLDVPEVCMFAGSVCFREIPVDLINAILLRATGVIDLIISELDHTAGSGKHRASVGNAIWCVEGLIDEAIKAADSVTVKPLEHTVLPKEQAA